MQRRLLILTLCAGLSGLTAALPARADSGADKQAMLNQVIRVMDQLGTVIPGEGLKSIKLGDPAAKLFKLLGTPQQVSGPGTASYQLSNRTVLHFLGKEKIESIVVDGQPLSRARVNNGIRFGMNRDQVLTQMDTRPDSLGEKRIRYSSRGIEYGFTDGLLTRIKVFRP